MNILRVLWSFPVVQIIVYILISFNIAMLLTFGISYCLGRMLNVIKSGFVRFIITSGLLIGSGIWFIPKKENIVYIYVVIFLLLIVLRRNERKANKLVKEKKHAYSNNYFEEKAMMWGQILISIFVWPGFLLAPSYICKKYDVAYGFWEFYMKCNVSIFRYHVARYTLVCVALILIIANVTIFSVYSGVKSPSEIKLEESETQRQKEMEENEKKDEIKKINPDAF